MTRAPGWLALLAVAMAVMALPAPAGARSRTTVTIFRAFAPDETPTIDTRSKSGYCWTASLAAQRDDAWRCFVGNHIYDPCFSSSRAPGVVICPNLQVNGGVEIRLTRRLPTGMADAGRPSVHAQPWNIELTNGHHCAFASGASNVVHGKRLNYFCGGGLKYGLWGFPRRRSQPWTILIGGFTATRLHQHRAIRRVWT